MFNPENIHVPDYGSDRYYTFEANGVCSFSGWKQRPAAERAARSSGKGLYDRRERTVLIQPRTGKRADAIERRLNAIAEERQELLDLNEEIEEVEIILTDDGLTRAEKQDRIDGMQRTRPSVRIGSGI